MTFIAPLPVKRTARPARFSRTLHFLPPFLLLVLLFVAAPAAAQQAMPQAAREPVDEEAVAAIRAHGLEDGRVMETLRWLSDVYGPRLTGSPNLRDASAWALAQLDAWGLENAHLEPWGPFGQGWSLERFSLHVTAPVTFPVLAYPQAWSPGVEGPAEAEVVFLDADSVAALAAYRGKLRGKIVLLDAPRRVEEPFEPEATRRDAEALLELANAVPAQPGPRRYNAKAIQRYRLHQARLRFLQEERPLLVLRASEDRGDYGSVHVGAVEVPLPPNTAWADRPQPWNPKGVDVLPQVSVAAEHYNRMYRLVEQGLDVRAEVDLDVTFHDEDPMEYNVLAEIPGTDPEIGDEVVLLGAHLDSWHAGTGATDNGAGSAVMMEAMRILQETFQELGVRPRRTIRVALWSGEEQGLHGSLAHVNRHYADLPNWSEPARATKPGHEKLSAYYNLDNGTGKIRGVFLEGNEAVRPIFAAWLAPLHDLGAATLSISNTGSTDHVPFDLSGLPGFQFIQDAAAYRRTHHSSMDLYDHALEADLQQAATVMAVFAYHTAQRGEKLPRKPLRLTRPAQAPAGSGR